MTRAPLHPRDPLAWCVVLSLAFLGLCLVRLGIPTKPYFDEIHYLPAARELLALGEWRNQEHPLLGKELIALGIALFGDGPWGWRLLPALAGAGALFAAMRALWFASRDRFATLAYGVLLASGFVLFVQSRIAMLDVFMLAFLALALWQCAAAVREPEQGRARLALAGLALGLAMAAKWNAIALAPAPGLTFLAWRLRAGGWRGLIGRRGAPVPGIALPEAALWLGLLPLAVYWLTFLPAYFFAQGPLEPGGFIALQQKMLALQEEVLKPHPYQSIWSDWVLNVRAIWYLYEPVDGAERGIVFVGNPLTMLAGLPALAWCAWAGITGRRDALAVALLYALSLGFWIVAAKPVQFYYHYLLPSMFLFAALALALAEWWRRGYRLIPLAVLAASCAAFAWFYPILSAAPLAGPQAFNQWMWLDTWR